MEAMNTTSSTGTRSTVAQPLLPRVLAGIALALVVALAPFFLASGLVAPLWAVIIFSVVWVGLVGLGVRWVRRHPLRVLPLPFVAAALWIGGVSLGEALLGWTA